MNHVIWKYRLPIGDRTPVPWPTAAQIVHIAHDPTDHEAVYMWVRRPATEDETPQSSIGFSVVGTGHTFPAYLTSVGSTIDHTAPYGPFVWHVMRWPS